MQNTFSKSERLKSEKSISLLFSEGQNAFSYPINLVYRKYTCHTDEDRPSVLTTVSVSKKKFKKAVERNRVKRQLRELYRLNKKQFYAFAGKECMDCMLIYTSSEKESFQKMENSLKKIFHKLQPRESKKQ